jgi:ABC-type nitrate/sulfonate/bicarbonate transport system substrate-binding protein
MTAEISPKSVWYAHSPAVAPLIIALRKGWLEGTLAREGIRLQSVSDHADPQIRRSYSDHHLSFQLRQGGNVPAIWARSNGARTRLLGLTWTEEYQAVVTLPSTGIKSARDLTGRRYAVPRFAPLGYQVLAPFAIRGLVNARATEGLDIAGIELVDVPVGRNPEASGLGAYAPKRLAIYADEALALLRGEIDAFYVKGSEGIAAASFIGATIVSEFGFHPDREIRTNAGTPRPLTVDQTFIDSRPDLLGYLVDDIALAALWSSQNRPEAIGILARENNIGEDFASLALGPDVSTALSLTLEPDELKTFSRYKQFLLDWKFIDKDFSLDDWIAPAFLAAGQSRSKTGTFSTP